MVPTLTCEPDFTLSKRSHGFAEPPTYPIIDRQPGYIPVSRPYEMTDLVYDLVLFARWMLVPGGRLVFFLPTVTEDWDDLDVPVVQGMKEIKFCSGSSQDFGRWSRRVSLESESHSPFRVCQWSDSFRFVYSLLRWKRPTARLTLDQTFYRSRWKKCRGTITSHNGSWRVSILDLNQIRRTRRCN